MAHDVFISYAAEDKRVADAICATLESRGFRCWIAHRNIRSGADWAASIVRAISKSRVMVLVFSSQSNTSDQVKREVNLALDKKVSIAPIRIEDVMPSETMEYWLNTVHWLDALTPPLENHLTRLADEVNALLNPTLTTTFREGQSLQIPKGLFEEQKSAEAQPSGTEALEPLPAKSQGIVLNLGASYLKTVRQRLPAEDFKYQENVQFNGRVFSLIATETPTLLNFPLTFLFSEFPQLNIERLEEFSSECQSYFDGSTKRSFLSSLLPKKIKGVVPVAVAHAVDESTLYSLRTKKDFISSSVTKWAVFPVIYNVRTGTLHHFEGYKMWSMPNIYMCGEKVKKLLGTA